MHESQWAGLLCLAGGVFAISASIGNWDWFMNSRKAKAWVKRIGRNNARWMYGGIGAFVFVFGLFMVIVAPGKPPAIAQSGSSEVDTNSQLQQGKTSRTEDNAETDGVSTILGSVFSDGTEQTPPSTTANQPNETSHQFFSTASNSKSIDLLNLIDVQRDRINGLWTKEDGAVVSSMDSPAGLQIPVEVPDNYQMVGVIEMVEGGEMGSFGIVVQGHGVSVLLSGPNGTNCGLQWIAGKMAKHNQTAYRKPALSPGRNEVICTVQGNHIVVTCNGKTIVDWQGDPTQLHYSMSRQNESKTPPLKIGSWNTRCRFSELRLIPLSDLQ